MAKRDDLRQSETGRSLLVARAAATALRASEWRVREAAEHAAGVADAAGERTWERKGVEARLHVVVRCHAAAGPVIFSESAATIEESLPAYSFGEDDPGQRRALRTLFDELGIGAAPLIAALHGAAYDGETFHAFAARVPPPRARTHAAAFRESDGGDDRFADAVDEAFASIDAIQRDLFAHDMEIIDDDAEVLVDEETAEAVERHLTSSLTALARQSDLIHPVVVTSAEIHTLGDDDRIAQPRWLRLHRARVVGAEQAWIDVVQSDAVDSYVAALTRHYETAFRRRRFR